MRRAASIFLVILILAILSPSALPSLAATKDTLVRFHDVFSTLDHYQSTMRGTIQLGYMVWDSLVTRNPYTGEIIPGLARSWKIVRSPNLGV